MSLLTVAEAAATSHRHPETIRDALRTGALCGGQISKRGPWTVDGDCIRPWLFGQDCEHHKNVTPIRRRKSA